VPGRITDELRRITREQGGVAAPSVDAPAAPEPRARRYGPLIALGVLLVLVGVGWLIVSRVMEMSRIQDCAMSGRKNCAPVDTSETQP
jgi:hypothetical protein